jgi:large conductance mechanosensitive channel
MFRGFKEFMLRRDLITVAVGFVMATAIFYLVEAIVEGLIEPLLSALVGDSSIGNNVFTVSGSELDMAS